MREIKFRAWDGERMLNRTLCDRNWYTHDDKCVRGAMPSDADTLKIVQYTGLKDANGVEIYEGDIVGPCSNGWNWVIEWGSFGDTGFYGSNQINSCRRLEPAPYSNDGAIIEITEDDILQCVVIGNIHENPELLK